MKKIFVLIQFILIVNITVQSQEYNIDNYVESKSTLLDNLYVTAGNKMYCVGFQDGSFPRIGHHVSGEMSGVWAQPIKLLDGFRLVVEDVSSDYKIDSMETSEFTTYPYMSKQVFNLKEIDMDIISIQFVANADRSMQVEYTFVNNTDRDKRLNLDFIGQTDLRSGFFSDNVGIKNGLDSLWIDKKRNVVAARDLANDWFVVVGSDAKVKSTILSNNSEENQFSLKNSIVVPANGSLKQTFYISGSDKSMATVYESLANIKNNYSKLFAEKKDHYANILDRSKINIPDKKMEKVFNWVRFNTEWLLLDVPEIGRGLCAGFPHYIWWFGCDNSYSLQGVLASGDFDIAKSTLRLLKEQSIKCNGNGRVIHEIVPSGGVVNQGNTQETPHFISAVWNTYMWTGDVEFLKEFYPFVKQGINWLLTEQDKNGNLFPEGYGIMEVKGLKAELIDVAVYTQQALSCVSQMANVFGDTEDAEYYKMKSTELKSKINNLFWDESSGIYCDFYGTAADAISVTEGAVEQFSDEVEETDMQKKFYQVVGLRPFYEKLLSYFNTFPKDYEHGWSTNRNWVISTPMEVGIAPKSQALTALERMSKNDFTGQWGPYLSAINKTHNMTMATGVQAVAECRYGRVDRGLQYVGQIVNTFGRVMPGSISEMMPNYGCITQEWTIYSVVVPIIQYVFGVKPNAPEKALCLEPQIPMCWEEYSLQNQKIGDTQFDWEITSNSKETTYNLKWTDKSWKSEIKLLYNVNCVYYCNGSIVDNINIKDDYVIFTQYGDVKIKVINKH